MVGVDRERLINLFFDLVRIKSPSGEERELAVFISNLLEQLDFSVTSDAYGNIVAKLAGIGESIVLCSHMDTVPIGGDFIRPQIVDGNKITSDGNTILGADNKDSIAAIFESIFLARENKLSHRPIELVFTRQEELISLGAKQLDMSLISGKNCIISDNAAPYGLITLGAPYNYRFNIVINGKRSHVKEPERGVDVFKILARAIAVEGLPLGRIDDWTTSNLAQGFLGLDGEITKADLKVENLSDYPRNTVPDICCLFGELRSLKVESLKLATDNIRIALEKATAFYGGTIDFQINSVADGYLYDKEDPLVVEIVSIFKDQNIEPRFFESVGGSDANVLIHKGLKTVVISSAHRDNHKKTEFVLIDELVLLADFYLRVICS